MLDDIVVCPKLFLQCISLRVSLLRAVWLLVLGSCVNVSFGLVYVRDWAFGTNK